MIFINFAYKKLIKMSFRLENPEKLHLMSKISRFQHLDETRKDMSWGKTLVYVNVLDKLLNWSD
jgi:hypothetical protein